MKRLIWILLLLSFSFICLGNNNKDTSKVINYGCSKVTYKHDSIYFIDSLGSKSKTITGYSFAEKSIVEIDPFRGSVQLQVDTIVGYYLISSIDKKGKQTIYYIDGSEVAYIVVNELSELFFVRRNNQLMILK